VQDAGNLITIVSSIEQQDGLNAFADAPLGGLLITSLELVSLAAG
jgi:hypothetical protein